MSMKILRSLRENGNMLIFILFALSVFIKCVYFHYACFNYVAVSSLWQAPLEFLAFYFAKLLPALFFASFVFLFKRQWWTIVASVIIDLWLIANVLYYRQCSLFIDIDVIKMAGNLNGFMSSILTYINWKTFVFVAITALYCGTLFFFEKRNEWLILKTSVKAFIIAFVTSLLLVVYDFTLGYGSNLMYANRNKEWYDINQFQWGWKVAKGKSLYSNLQRPNLVERGSVFHYFPCLFIYELSLDRNREVEFSYREKEILSEIVGEKKQIQLDNNLIFVLVESFESWALNMRDLRGDEVTPNINAFRSKHSHLFCTKIKSQTRNGGSGDGQMIENTGLLPLNSGAACMLYGTNIYPNYAHFWSNSTIIDPCANDIWNQPQMTKCYDYKDIYPNSQNDMVGTEDDMVVFQYAIQHIDSLKKEPFCLHIITMSMHTPFTRVDCPSMKWPNDMPSNLRNYLNAVHYTDSAIAPFLEKLESDSLLANTTIVITGDHTTFSHNMLMEYASFVKKYGYPIPTETSYCPLIVCSPTIKEKTVVDEVCYQMDIFPTILHCIGADDYYWKGFGVNLLDSTARHNRQIIEDEAYILSDKMIRSDYFRGIEK